MKYLETLKKQVVVLDGAMGTMIQNLELSDADFGGPDYKMLSDLLTFSRADDLKNIHLEYLKAGANAIETNTFGASKLRLQEYDFSKLDTAAFQSIPEGLVLQKLSYDEFAYHLNKAAAEIARRAIDEHQKAADFDGRPLFVFGSIGPSNWVLSSTKANLNRGTYEKIEDNFYHQVLGLIDGGADVLLFETQQDQLELKAAIHGAQKALQERGVRLPIQAQVTVDQFSKMQIFNTDILAALGTVQGIGIDVFGINCSIGPDQMIQTVKKLSQHSKIPISIIPNAGLPVSENGKTVFKQSPDDLSRHLKQFVEEFGVNVVGGCCGTTPAHIAAIAKTMKTLTPKQRNIPVASLVSGPQNACELDSETSLIRIGERLNVRGSQKVREAVENDGELDVEALEEVVSEQINDLGLEIIDVCMDSNLVNTEETLVKVITELTTDFQGVMCLDSFSVEALIDAIKVYPGRPIINSISLEEYSKGVDKIDAVVGPTKKHNPVYVALCTGPEGPAQTADEKYDLAKQIYDKCRTEHGLNPDQFIFDVNAFPIGSEAIEGMNFAMESIRSIAKVKSLHPEVKVSMGVGNLTNGLAKKPYMRKVLTSVFMDLARQEGLDAAIINPHHYVPVESLEKDHVVLARKVIVDRDMDAFADLEVIAEEKKGIVVVKRSNYDDLSLEDAVCQKIKDGYKQREQGTITVGDFSYNYNDKIVLQVSEALKTHDPLEFINSHLMAAMKDLGDGFGRGEVSLPHLLKSADVMKSCMGYIESFMKHGTGADVHEQLNYKGVVVLGTVYQDVHSIGKDLVKTLLENYGYRVIDLGVQTPLEKYIETAKEYKANAIGMSALLVQTSNHMITVAKMLVDEGLGDVDILIGGAPVNNRHAAYVSMHGQEDGDKILSNVFYCPSGMDGVNVLNQLRESKDKRSQMLSENKEKLKWHFEQATRQSLELDELLKSLPRRDVNVDEISRDNITTLGFKRVTMSLKDFKPHLDLKTLFSLNWKYGGKSSWQKKGVTQEMLEAQLDEWIVKCDANNWLAAEAVFGLFPCRRAGDDVVVFDPRDQKTELARVPFTVVVGADKKDVFSAAQYFLNGKAPSNDVIGLQISTGGRRVDDQIAAFKADGDTESSHLLQGLSDRVAEDMAEWTHQTLRRMVGIKEREGTRYSPGYPGLKDLAVNKLLADLLKAENELGVTLTDANEFYPTGTTGAVVCFHPKARYD